MTETYTPKTGTFISTRISAPPIQWVWHVFGDPNIFTVHLTFAPPLWRRIITRILLGSVWEKKGTT